MKSELFLKAIKEIESCGLIALAVAEEFGMPIQSLENHLFYVRAVARKIVEGE